PAYVKPYVKRQKNDMGDAEAICEAVTRANMRFVPIKTPKQQSGLVLHRTRHLFIRQQTAVINAIRAHLAEFGIVKHWNGEDGPIVTKLDGRYDKWILRDVRRHPSHVGDVAHLLRCGDTPQGSIGRGADDWIARSCLHECKWCIVLRNET